MDTTTRIRITGMTCAHCVGAVTRALKALPGVNEAQVQLAPAQATVTGEAKVEDLLKAIAEEGYKGVVA
jgi:copper chaperone